MNQEIQGQEDGFASAGESWLAGLPEQLRRDYLNTKVRAQISQMPSDTPLTPELAALYLDLSDSTLKRMRANATGPEYVQSVGSQGTTARNHKIIYKVGALKDWMSKNATVSTGEAAVRRGMMFGNMANLFTPEPWWVQGDRLVGHGLCIDVFEAIDHCSLWDEQQSSEDWHLEWLTTVEALERVWLSAKHRGPYDEGYELELRMELERHKAIKEKAILEDLLVEPAKDFEEDEEDISPEVHQALWRAYLSGVYHDQDLKRDGGNK